MLNKSFSIFIGIIVGGCLLGGLSAGPLNMGIDYNWSQPVTAAAGVTTTGINNSGGVTTSGIENISAGGGSAGAYFYLTGWNAGTPAAAEIYADFSGNIHIVPAGGILYTATNSINIDPGSGSNNSTLILSARSGGTAEPATIWADQSGIMNFDSSSGQFNFKKNASGSPTFATFFASTGGMTMSGGETIGGGVSFLAPVTTLSVVAGNYGTGAVTGISRAETVLNTQLTPEVHTWTNGILTGISP